MAKKLWIEKSGSGICPLNYHMHFPLFLLSMYVVCVIIHTYIIQIQVISHRIRVFNSKDWKQCSSEGVWFNKLFYLHSEEILSSPINSFWTQNTRLEPWLWQLLAVLTLGKLFNFPVPYFLISNKIDNNNNNATLF